MIESINHIDKENINEILKSEDFSSIFEIFSTYENSRLRCARKMYEVYKKLIFEYVKYFNPSPDVIDKLKSKKSNILDLYRNLDIKKENELKIKIELFKSIMEMKECQNTKTEQNLILNEGDILILLKNCPSNNLLTFGASQIAIVNMHHDHLMEILTQVDSPECALVTGINLLEKIDHGHRILTEIYKHCIELRPLIKKIFEECGMRPDDKGKLEKIDQSTYDTASLSKS